MNRERTLALTMVVRHHVRPFRALIGAAMAVAGVLAVVMTVIAAAAPTPAFDRLAFTLGLAGGPLLSGMAQVAGLIGVWLVWTAVVRSKR